MEGESKAKIEELPKEGGVSERSTIEFPYADLDNAVEIVKGVHAVGGTACDWDQLAAHLAMEAKGGGFRIRVSGAKAHGLLTYDRGGRIALTDLGRQIIDPQHERAARVEAFLKVPLFAKVYDNYKGSPLPPQAGLERALNSYGVGAKVVKNARQVLMRSAKQAGYFELSPDRLTAPPIRGKAAEHPKDKDEKKNGSGGTGSGSGSGGGSGHPLIDGLLQTLPPPNATWSSQDRMNWLVMANSIFKIIYQSQDNGDVAITYKQPPKEDSGNDLA